MTNRKLYMCKSRWPWMTLNGKTHAVITGNQKVILWGRNNRLMLVPTHLLTRPVRTTLWIGLCYITTTTMLLLHTSTTNIRNWINLTDVDYKQGSTMIRILRIIFSEEYVHIVTHSISAYVSIRRHRYKLQTMHWSRNLETISTTVTFNNAMLRVIECCKLRINMK